MRADAPDLHGSEARRLASAAPACGPGLGGTGCGRRVRRALWGRRHSGAGTGECAPVEQALGGRANRRLSVWTGACGRRLHLPGAPRVREEIRGLAARRTAFEHFKSFRVKSSRYRCGRMRLLLVDDVITRGRTVLAAAARLRQVFPGCELGAFALLRTLRADDTPWRNPDPCQGTVRWLGNDARREP